MDIKLVYTVKTAYRPAAAVLAQLSGPFVTNILEKEVQARLAKICSDATVSNGNGTFTRTVIVRTTPEFAAALPDIPPAEALSLFKHIAGSVAGQLPFGAPKEADPTLAVCP